MIPYQNVVVVGCGRLGSILANRLSRQGCSVVVVDRDEGAFRNLSTEFSGFQIVGDAAEMAVLRQAEVEKADCLLAVTRHDNVNLMVAQVAAQILGAPKVIARVADPAREEVYRHFGIETICPVRLSAGAFVRALEKRAEDEPA